MRIAVDHSPAILKTAARYFARKPFHEVHMDDVADACGIAKGTIYRHYPNKEALFLAITLDWMDRLAEQLRKAARKPHGAVERLEAMVVSVAVQYRKQRDFFEVMQREELNGGRTMPPERLRKREVLRDAFAEVIREGQRAGDLRRFDPTVAADLLLGMIRSQLRFGDPKQSPEALAARVLDAYLNGLASRRRRTSLQGDARA